MTPQQWITDLVDDQGGMRLYEQERTIVEATELICELLETSGVSRTELAKRLRKTKGYISQLLDGETNMTLRTLSDALYALGREVHFTSGPIEKPYDGWSQPVQFQGNTAWPTYTSGADVYSLPHNRQAIAVSCEAASLVG